MPRYRKTPVKAYANIALSFYRVLCTNTVHISYICITSFNPSPPFHNVGRGTLAFCTVFSSHSNCLAPILFPRGGKKGIGEWFENKRITPRTLAYWFMDDGGLLCYNKDYPRRAMVFNTQGFTLSECEILQRNINGAYNLDSWLSDDGKGPYIVIPAHRADYLRDIVSPYMCNSMLHKLRATKAKASGNRP